MNIVNNDKKWLLFALKNGQIFVAYCENPSLRIQQMALMIFTTLGGIEKDRFGLRHATKYTNDELLEKFMGGENEH